MFEFFQKAWKRPNLQLDLHSIMYVGFGAGATYLRNIRSDVASICTGESSTTHATDSPCRFP